MSSATKTTGQKRSEYWDKQIGAALTRDRAWRKVGREIIELYEAEKDNDSSFNVLYSNTETLAPAVYNALPRPYVTARNKDDQTPLAKAVATTIQRALTYVLDSPSAEYPSFHECMNAAVLSALLPGRGVTRFKYEAEIKESEKGEDPAADKEPAEQNVGDTHDSTEPMKVEAPTGEVVSECVYGQPVIWDEVVVGPAKRWEDVPWVAYMHKMTRADVKENFEGFDAKLLKYTVGVRSTLEGSEEDAPTKAEKDEEESREAGEAEVWEIWHKTTRKVIFFSPEYKEGLIKEMEVPLKLSGFFNQPPPLQFLARVRGTTPKALYQLYRTQARELNRINLRINKIVDALKVRGFYDGRLKGLESLLKADDNVLLPGDLANQIFTEGSGVDKLIWMMPLEKLVAALQVLYTAREQCKQVIYEITGISDILRGASVASETATAQNIKNQWGTLRLKRAQAIVQEYVRASLRLITEIIGANFSEETLAKITGLQYATKGELEQAQQVLQAAQVMAQQAQMTGQQPQPNPQMAQQLQQAQAVMQKVKWSDVVGVLRDGVLRGYLVDIETNSTIDVEATEDQKNISEMLGGLAQLVQSLGPLTQSGQMPPAAFKAILLTVARRFKFGREVEEQLASMADQLPQQGQDPKAQADAQKAQAETKKMQLEMQVTEAEVQGKLKLMQAQQALEQERITMKREELQLKRQEMRMKFAASQKELEMKAAGAQQNLQVDIARTQMEMVADARQHEQAMVQGDQQHQQAMEHSAQMGAIKAKQAAQNPPTSKKKGK